MYDLILFGASGITGELVLEEISKYAATKESFKWAIAGRSESKLKKSLETASRESGADLKTVPLIIADVSDPVSLSDMCKQTKLLLNCVGPYELYGEPVVKACIENGCDHLDVTGEPLFLESISEKYHELATEKGVSIIGACGFDSVPSDLGVYFLKDHFNGDVNSIEVYLSMKTSSKLGGMSIGTWKTIINSISTMRKVKEFRAKQKRRTLPKSSFKIQERFMIHYNEHVKGWCIPFLGSDMSIVRRSQLYFYEEEKERPAQVKIYFRVGSLLSTLALLLYGLFLGAVCSFGCGRNLCTKYFRFFSFGMVTDENIAREGETRHVFVGNGWDTKLNSPEEQHDTPPNKTMITEIHSETPGYVATAAYLMSCASAMLEQRNKVPSGGGVYTTAGFFRHTAYKEFLAKQNIHFQVKSEISLKTAKTESLPAEE